MPPAEAPDAEGHLSPPAINQADETRRRPLVIGGIVAAAVVSLGALALALVVASEDDGLTLTGEFALSDTDSIRGGPETCSGTGGYSDFGPGMNVTVRNGSGEIVASGTSANIVIDEYFGDNATEERGDGRSDDDSDDMSPEELADLMFEFLGCTVVFEVDVPSEDFYVIEVGRRGELSYSRTELEERNWNVSLSLGD
ncbi:hypothetical protein [Rhabdothermincola salaria]|uniref:hypothetical protein n=1 Tax=Rhabdothermincola salaria TaxID=2903142 RepID=UPI001E2EE6AE|nr:hypothetical protein [Rhabdothermincola salaria]MCD9623933.1 hypothetical protein [Rhabdothermincola salaria]